MNKNHPDEQVVVLAPVGFGSSPEFRPRFPEASSLHDIAVEPKAPVGTLLAGKGYERYPICKAELMNRELNQSLLDESQQVHSWI